MHWLQFDLSFCLISNILLAYSNFVWALSSFTKYECPCGLFKYVLQHSWSGVSFACCATFLRNIDKESHIRHISIVLMMSFACCDTFLTNIDKDWGVCPGHTSVTTLLYWISLKLINFFSMIYRKTSIFHSIFWGKQRVSVFRTGTIYICQWCLQQSLLLPISDEIRSKSSSLDESRKANLSILFGLS